MIKWVKKLKFINFHLKIDFYKKLTKILFSIEFCEKNQYNRHYKFNNKQTAVFAYNR